MRVGLDVDGCLRDMMKGLIERYNQEHNEDLREHHITKWEFKEFFPKYPRDIYHDAFHVYPQTTFEEAPPYPGAVEFVQALAQRHDVWIITHQYPGNEQYTLNWLHMHKIPYHSLVFTPDKHVVGCDVLVDDSVGNLERFAATGRQSLCLARPWNQHYTGLRAADFTELAALLP